MKKKQIIGGVIALIAVYGLYRVFSKPKAIAGGAESERSSGEEGQPSDQGGYSGGGYSGGGYGGGYSNNGYTQQNTGGSGSGSGQNNSGSGMPAIDLGKFQSQAGPTRMYTPPPPAQPEGSGSIPRVNPYLKNIPTFNDVRDTKSAAMAAANLAAKIKTINVNVVPQPSFTIGKPRF